MALNCPYAAPCEALSNLICFWCGVLGTLSSALRHFAGQIG